MKAIVCLNSGSSSIKFALYVVTLDGEPQLSAGGKVEGIGTAPHLIARTIAGEVLVERTWPEGAALTHSDLLAALFGWAEGHLDGYEVIAVGHRVVHGGTQFTAPRIVDDALLGVLDALCPLAPLHQPHNLAAIRSIAALQPHLLQVACFDTAFHHGRPEIASRFALPRPLHDHGIRRYGFHGLSYEYVARRLRDVDPQLAGRRVIVAHLGNGASACAMRDGRSVDTSMGFTALDGLMMGTRCGTVDPGVVLHLQVQMGMSAAEVEDLLYKKSGLLGVSGISSDMRTLWSTDAAEAREAIDLFIWRAVRELGALGASLGGLDGLVFTAGIGENDARIRSGICHRLEWLGVRIDEDANAVHGPRISLPDSPVAVHVIPTDEERMIAFHTLSLLAEQNA